VAGLLKARSETVRAGVAAAMMFYGEAEPPAEELDRSLTAEVRPALAEVARGFSTIGDWSEESIMGAVNAVLKQRKLKLPQIAMPLRLIVFGRAQTPNIGPTLAVAGRKRVLERLRKHVGA
jgi:glutamyl-tRNA synthetase